MNAKPGSLDDFLLAVRIQPWKVKNELKEDRMEERRL